MQMALMMEFTNESCVEQCQNPTLLPITAIWRRRNCFWISAHKIGSATQYEAHLHE